MRVSRRYFPGLWEYYAHTALEQDSFFGATGGIGYTYPWSLPDHNAFFRGSAALFDSFMPSPDNFIDLWESGCPSSPNDGGSIVADSDASVVGDNGAAAGAAGSSNRDGIDARAEERGEGGENPCMPMYQRYRDLSNKTVAGFSQAPTLQAQNLSWPNIARQQMVAGWHRCAGTATMLVVSGAKGILQQQPANQPVFCLHRWMDQKDGGSKHSTTALPP